MEATTPTAAPDRGDVPPLGMVRIPGGVFAMGSNDHYPEERPVHRVAVDPFWMDETPVTNRQFREFVQATGYVTFAEVPPRAEDYPGASPHMLKAGSLVFTPPKGPVDLNQPLTWWEFSFGANWRRPQGRNSTNRDLDDHPVVHVTHRDATAYATWIGKELPTEAEWEFAARGGLDSKEFAWGNELYPGGKPVANTWQGQFPVQNLRLDGYDRTSPVKAFEPNGYGLFDMIGNTWEWTEGWFVARHVAEEAKACCIPQNPRGPSLRESIDPRDPARIPRKVLKGRLTSLCTELLPAIPACRPSSRANRHIDKSRRFPVCVEDVALMRVALERRTD